MAQKNNLRWVVGVHACLECLRVSPKSVRELYFLDIKLTQSPLWVPFLQKLKIKPAQKSVGFFKELSEFGHQGVALATDYKIEKNKIAEDRSSILFLDGVEDPHNLGAIIRTSWLMGVEQIYVSEKNSVKLTPTVCKVATGGAEHVPVSETHFLSEMKDLKEEGYWIYGFSEKATKTLYDIEFAPKSVLIYGSEEKGIRLPVLNECDELLSIPQITANASYNVSVSVAVGLAEFNRQVQGLSKNSGK